MEKRYLPLETNESKNKCTTDLSTINLFCDYFAFCFIGTGTKSPPFPIPSG